MTPRRDALGAQHGSLAIDVDLLHVLAMSAHDVLPPARMRALLDRELRDLAAALQVHFGFEELGGYLIEEIATAPGLQRQAAALEGQHRTIVVGVDRLIARVGDDDLEDVKRGIAELLDVLGEHERGENRLLLDAVDRDVGVVD
jgi:hypothetical protein